MTEPSDLSEASLNWRQAGTWSRNYELFEHGSKRGSLSFLKTLGTLAEGQIDGSVYTFKRAGFLRPQVTIRRRPHDVDIGKVNMSLGSRGALELSDGSKYSFQRQSFWKNIWSFSNEQGDLVMTVHMEYSLVRRSGDIVLGPRGRDDPHAPLLMLLGWYMMVLIDEENTAAATAAAT